jgi:putative endopeptidase
MPKTKKARPATEETLPIPSPSEDFYGYVNYAWLRDTPIPPSESVWGSFNILAHTTFARLKGIAEHLSADSQQAKKGSNEQLVADFYRSGMDMDTRNKLGLEPLSELRAAIHDVADTAEALRAIAQLKLKGVSPFFGTYFNEDSKKAGSNALYMYQAGLGLPNREYYLKDEASMEDVRGKYKQYISTIFQLTGRTKTEAANAAKSVYTIEYALAQASITEEETREYDKNYFKYTVATADKDFPGIDWGVYFGALGKPDIQDFVIMQPQFMKKVGEVLQHTDLGSIKDYMEFRLLNTMAGALDTQFADASFAFNGKVLSGLKKPRPLWKRTVSALHTTPLTEVIGPLYCAEFFNPQDKVKIMEMVANVREAFRERVRGLDWMTPQTKELTWKKLDIITFKMGFPDEWLDVSKVTINADTHAANRMALAEFNFKRKLATLEGPYDRSEWHMPPTLVNAYSDLKREMTYPAAILQHPFYDSARDDAYNYGSIGMVIGHELTHFFDDQGCKFDLNGNLTDWWTDQDRHNFQEKTKEFVRYYSRLTADGLQVNGQLTLGENIADVAGMIIAYDALQKSKIGKDDTNVLIDGLTAEQRFFVGYARLWAQKITPELARERILTDPHAPAKVRVNGVLAANPQFHAAFGVEPGDQMYTSPSVQPKLW